MNELENYVTEWNPPSKKALISCSFFKTGSKSWTSHFTALDLDISISHQQSSFFIPAK